MKLEPLREQILILPQAQEEKTESGIIIPTTIKENNVFGDVVATGPGHLLESGEVVPLAVKVGDTVLLDRRGVSEVKVDGVVHYLTREQNILGKVSK